MVKLPIKVKIIYIDKHDDYCNGEIELHDKKFMFKIIKNDEKTLKIPFGTIGIKNQMTLLRISGVNGIYAEENLKIIGKSTFLEINSSQIFDDIGQRFSMFDTFEFFFR